MVGVEHHLMANIEGGGQSECRNKHLTQTIVLCRALFCPWCEKLSLKSDEPTELTQQNRMLNAIGNDNIIDPR